MPTIATLQYLGPPIANCGSPIIKVVNSNGSNLNFLSAFFNDITGIISITLPTPGLAVKGNYTLNAVFEAPGAFSFTTGVTL